MILPAFRNAMGRAARACRCRRAASAVEYSLIIALIVLAVLAGVQALASATTQKWNDVGSNMASVTPP